MYYTKYRPQKFTEISKPNDVAEALMNQVKNSKTVHAYLFVGSRGTGKTTTARILAKALNCSKVDNNGDPCLECDTCALIKNGNFVDLIEIDAASNRGIDDIRDLRDKVKLAPAGGKTKVYIIDEVHMLTNEAFNALLKTLEEPPKHVVFILCTTEFHKVPDTIKSRCQVFKFKRATKAQLIKKLEAICVEERVENLTKEDLGKIAEASFGGFRDAETILQQVVEGNLDPQSFVGVASKQIYVTFVSQLLAKDTKSCLLTLDKSVEDGIDLNVWVLGLVEYLRDLLFVKSDAHEGLIDVSEEILEKIKDQAKIIGYDDIVFFTETFVDSANKIDDSMIPHLPLELAVIKICAGATSSRVNTSTAVDKDDGGNGNKYKKLNKKSDSTLVEEFEDLDIELSEDTADVLQTEIIVENKSTVTIEIIDVKANWSKIIKESVQYNNSIHALLKASEPIEIQGNDLFLDVGYKFHKERLEAPKNRKVVESVLVEVLGTELNIRCNVNPDKKSKKKKSPRETGELTDYNVSAPAYLSDTNKNEDLANIFDGGLPL